ncbi:MAG: hypothetical protein ACYC24_06850 [Desulfobacteria bacterium]
MWNFDLTGKAQEVIAMEDRGRMTAGRGRPPGSRVLLGIALFAGILMSMCGGALLADFALDLLGVASPPVRLGAKVIAMATALPAGFYLVERAFLARSSTSRKTPGP